MDLDWLWSSVWIGMEVVCGGYVFVWLIAHGVAMGLRTARREVIQEERSRAALDALGLGDEYEMDRLVALDMGANKREAERIVRRDKIAAKLKAQCEAHMKGLPLP